ncbi:hypothetical protein [Aliiruegeria lutimaris]|uniref:Uncharacterized protein n=1 Tax=Aliiruegeria lutimaris TaxID=571298 RepID=A0A1G9JU92_9RHOB|nr:hypothetical protein [Aliiruegeria lutimaris]SDL41051.1 hypothetical protein SAMN04488026_10842 [Aliiruegeria lutimaris]
MLEYHPEICGTLNLVFNPKLSDRDIAVLRTLRQADPEGEILWMKQDLQMLAYMFKYMLNWMHHTGEVAPK